MSKIEWTGKTWNFLKGCSLVSKGCENCYAMRMAYRLQHNPKMADQYAGLARKTTGGKVVWTGKINIDHERLLYPLQIKKPTVFFVNSMSDLFHEDVPFNIIDKAFAVMALCPQHTFQVLTKRPQRMLEYMESRDEYYKVDEEAAYIVASDPHLFHVLEKLSGEAKENVGPYMITNELLPHLKMAGWAYYATYSEFGKDVKLIFDGGYPAKNIWLGVSVEDQKTADERIHYLNNIPAAIKFLSCEPLLGPVDFEKSIGDSLKWHAGGFKNCISWVICGGESGPNARPMHPDWARSLRDQCNAAGVSFFFKQWGEWYPDKECKKTADYDSTTGKHKTELIDCNGKHDNELFLKPEWPVRWRMLKVGKKKAGRLLDGREWNEYPGGQPSPP